MQTNQTFGQAWTQFWGESVSSPKQVTWNASGEELAEFCDSYFKLRLENSGLKHFSSGEKAKYMATGILLALALVAIAAFLIFGPKLLNL